MPGTIRNARSLTITATAILTPAVDEMRLDDSFRFRQLVKDGARPQCSHLTAKPRRQHCFVTDYVMPPL